MEVGFSQIHGEDPQQDDPFVKLFEAQNQIVAGILLGNGVTFSGSGRGETGGQTSTGDTSATPSTTDLALNNDSDSLQPLKKLRTNLLASGNAWRKGAEAMIAMACAMDDPEKKLAIGFSFLSKAVEKTELWSEISRRLSRESMTLSASGETGGQSGDAADDAAGNQSVIGKATSSMLVDLWATWKGLEYHPDENANAEERKKRIIHPEQKGCFRIAVSRLQKILFGMRFAQKKPKKGKDGKNGKKAKKPPATPPKTVEEFEGAIDRHLAKRLMSWRKQKKKGDSESKEENEENSAEAVADVDNEPNVVVSASSSDTDSSSSDSESSDSLPTSDLAKLFAQKIPSWRTAFAPTVARKIDAADERTKMRVLGVIDGVRSLVKMSENKCIGDVDKPKECSTAAEVDSKADVNLKMNGLRLDKGDEREVKIVEVSAESKILESSADSQSDSDSAQQLQQRQQRPAKIFDSVKPTILFPTKVSKVNLLKQAVFTREKLDVVSEIMIAKYQELSDQWQEKHMKESVENLKRDEQTGNKQEEAKDSKEEGKAEVKAEAAGRELEGGDVAEKERETESSELALASEKVNQNQVNQNQVNQNQVNQNHLRESNDTVRVLSKEIKPLDPNTINDNFFSYQETDPESLTSEHAHNKWPELYRDSAEYRELYALMEEAGNEFARDVLQGGGGISGTPKSSAKAPDSDGGGGIWSYFSLSNNSSENSDPDKLDLRPVVWTAVYPPQATKKVVQNSISDAEKSAEPSGEVVSAEKSVSNNNLTKEKELLFKEELAKILDGRRLQEEKVKGGRHGAHAHQDSVASCVLYARPEGTPIG
jgi:hypothetical protein